MNRAARSSENDVRAAFFVMPVLQSLRRTFILEASVSEGVKRAMRVTERLIRPVTEVKYLNADNAERYRSIMRIFF